jgi:predicted phage baseplate assembly protein
LGTPELSTDLQFVALQLGNRAGDECSVTVPLKAVTLVPSLADDEIVSELVIVDSITDDATNIVLQHPLQRSYDRATVSINANVAHATHGETVSEVLGSGDASQTFQRFTLRHSPLTQVSVGNSGGAESTLALRVNGVRWQQAPFLYGQGANEHVHIDRIADDGTSTVEFGDGTTGARAATGQENVTATYRKGIGLAGNVQAGQLSILLTRPLGVKAVTNPCPAEGAMDPETSDQARQTAPTKVLTLERAVSLEDYEDFAQTSNGIGKAFATWAWVAGQRVIVLTVAGAEGAPLDETGDKVKNLYDALRASGDPFAPVLIKACRPSMFWLDASIQIAADYSWDNVSLAIESALLSKYSFDARAFGQPVSLSEVMAVMQNVDGVVAVDVTVLSRTKNGTDGLDQPLTAELSGEDENGNILGAELLLLDLAHIKLEVMK